MAMNNLKDLFVHFVRDMYYAEKQILKALPKMARKADSPKLREAFEGHLAETESQVDNLEKVFDLLGLKPLAQFRGVSLTPALLPEAVPLEPRDRVYISG